MTHTYCCYIELVFDSGINDLDHTEYAMGAIGVDSTLNETSLKSIILINYFLFNKQIDMSDIFLICLDGKSWYIRQEDQIFYLVDALTEFEIKIENLTQLPLVHKGLWLDKEIEISRLKVIDKQHFDVLKGMYHPNFEVNISN